MRVTMIRLIGMAASALPSASALAMEHAPSATTSTAPPHWSYDGEHGPAHWGDVAPDDAVCGNGKSQSPINLSSGTAKAGNNGAFKINYETGAVALLNNGHTVQADVGDTADTISLDGAAYTLAQFHFHTPSEHTVDGKYFPLEIHFVNKDAGGHIAVVGVLVQTGAENTLLAPVFSSLPATATPAGTHAGKPLQVDIAAVLPKISPGLCVFGFADDTTLYGRCALDRPHAADRNVKHPDPGVQEDFPRQSPSTAGKRRARSGPRIGLNGAALKPNQCVAPLMALASRSAALRE